MYNLFLTLSFDSYNIAAPPCSADCYILQ